MKRKRQTTLTRQGYMDHRMLCKYGSVYSGVHANVITGEVSHDPKNIYRFCKLSYIDGEPCWFDTHEDRVVQWITLDDMIKCIPDTDPDFKMAFRKLNASLEHKHRVLKRIHANSKGVSFPAFRTEGAE